MPLSEVYLDSFSSWFNDPTNNLKICNCNFDNYTLNGPLLILSYGRRENKFTIGRNLEHINGDASARLNNKLFLSYQCYPLVDKFKQELRYKLFQHIPNILRKRSGIC